MLTLVVICHSAQEANLKEILPACKNQDADHCVLVLASVSDVSTAKVLANKYGFETLIPNHEISGFSAGANRDAAITYAEANYSGTDFVFVDGDCVPSPDLVRHHRRVLTSHLPVITCGLRKNRSATALPESDRRLAHPLTKNRLFVPGLDREMFDSRDISQHHVCWSCNLGINSKAVSRTRAANSVLVPNTTRVFSSLFDGQWGGEDTLLGLAGFRSGCSLVMIDPLQSWIEHIPHSTKHQVLDNLRRCHGLDVQLCSGLLKTSVSEIISSARPDTAEFYSGIVNTPRRDPNTQRLVDSLLETDASLSRYSDTIHYMFSRNPEHIVVAGSRAEKPPYSFTSMELGLLYARIRTHAVPFQVKD